MNDDSRAIVATLTGAVMGGFAGFLFFSERGRTLRRQMVPAFEEFANDLDRLGHTIEKAVGAANEGWKVLSDVVGGAVALTPPPNGRHTAPF